MLNVPVGSRHGEIPEGAATRKVEVSGDSATVEIRDAQVDDGDATSALRNQGLDPNEWETTGFRSSVWTMANGEQGESKRFTFRRLSAAAVGPDIDELLAVIDGHQNLACGASEPREGIPGIIIPLGDMQFGKTDMEDWSESEALDNTLSLLDATADRIAEEFLLDPVGKPEIAIVWLGDHVEGFVSQGGSNSWRTKLTLSEQIRLTRRVMMYAVEVFHPLASRLTCVAVPGNHGETVRFQGKGITRYDDSHDTEALICVSEVCQASPLYQDVVFLVPDNDELTVQFDIANTTCLTAHGHAWRKGKHWEWWEGQTFHGNAGASATVLLAGHLHHLNLESSGKRFFLQVPALESGSNWYRMLTGTRPFPGVVTLKVLNGQVIGLEGLWK